MIFTRSPLKNGYLVAAALGFLGGYLLPWRVSVHQANPIENPRALVGTWATPHAGAVTLHRDGRFLLTTGNEKTTGEWKVSPKQGLCMRAGLDPTAVCFRYTARANTLLLDGGTTWVRVASLTRP